MNGVLLDGLSERSPLGLADGRMGVCLYLFRLGRLTGKAVYTRRAEEVLESVFREVRPDLPLGLKDGLVGLGLGVTRLVREGYVKGKVNTVLADMDDTIFRRLSYARHTDALGAETLVHLLFYLWVRSADRNPRSEDGVLFGELMAHVAELAYGRIAPESFIEPLYFTADYFLPQLLYVLGCVRRTGRCRERVTKMLEELGPVVLSAFPVVEAHRLYLGWGMESVLAAAPLPGWEAHRERLRREIDVGRILDEELGGRNIYFHEGYPGVYALLRALAAWFPAGERERQAERIRAKMERSAEWEVLKSNPAYFRTHRGLLNGFCGAALACMLLSPESQRSEL